LLSAGDWPVFSPSLAQLGARNSQIHPGELRGLRGKMWAKHFVCFKHYNIVFSAFNL